MLRNKRPEELRNVKWYISITDDQSKEQVGWFLADVFRNEGGKYILNRGRFAANLFKPPA